MAPTRAAVKSAAFAPRRAVDDRLPLATCWFIWGGVSALLWLAILAPFIF